MSLALASLVAASVTGTPVARMATVASSVISRRPVRALCAPGVAAGAERERSLVRLVMA